MLDFEEGDIVELLPNGQPDKELNWWFGVGLIVEVEEEWTTLQMFTLTKINKKTFSEVEMGPRIWRIKTSMLKSGGARLVQ